MATDIGLPDQIDHFTDLGNARRLVKRHGQDLRYCYPWRRWLVWDGTRWAIDTTGEVERRAKETIQALYADGLAQAHWALDSEARARLRAMVELARSEPNIPVLPAMLDADPWTLNVPNGTLDLKSGHLGPHCRTDLITKLAPVKYDPAATCPTWLRFLDQIMDHNQSVIDFLQRAFGYALTGDISEQVLFFGLGTGANGKSTLYNTFRALLGPDYAQHTPTETLLIKARGGSIPNDLARLKGARFVSAVEADTGRRLDEVLVKQLTGGDPVTARFLRQEFFEFTPMFKLFVAANHKPLIQGTDYATWRRLLLIPFSVIIPPAEQDKTLPEKFRQEASGILAWCLRGCLAWQAQGLAVPDEIKAATQAYREEMDVHGSFLNECVIRDAQAEVTAQELYTAYKAWCEQNDERPLAKKGFGQWLKEQGFVQIRIGAGSARGWSGLRLRA